MSDALPGGLPNTREMAGELLRCGWRAAASDASDTHLLHTARGVQTAQCQRFTCDSGGALWLIGLDDVEPSEPEALFARFLDLPMEGRLALTLARRLGDAERVVLVTLGRVELFRLDDEQRECRAATDDEYRQGWLPALTALARPGGHAASGAAPHGPGHAEALGGWVDHWTLRLAGALECAPGQAAQLIWRWIVMLQIARRFDEPEVSARWGLRCRRDGARLSVAYDATSATADLRELLKLFDARVHSRRMPRADDLTDPAGRPLADRLDELEADALLDRFRAELLMQTQVHFEPETVAWLFTDLAREQEGWRREINGPEPIHRRLQHDGWTVHAPLVCDVERFGLTAALADIERLAVYLDDLHHCLMRRRATREEASVNQPDLFRPNLRGVTRDGRLDDGLNYLFGEALRVHGVAHTGDAALGVAVVFVLKALSLAARLDWPWAGLQTLDTTLSNAECGMRNAE